jgi:hypothetical protein
MYTMLASRVQRQQHLIIVYGKLVGRVLRNANTQQPNHLPMCILFTYILRPISTGCNTPVPECVDTFWRVVRWLRAPMRVHDFNVADRRAIQCGIAPSSDPIASTSFVARAFPRLFLSQALQRARELRRM